MEKKTNKKNINLDKNNKVENVEKITKKAKSKIVPAYQRKNDTTNKKVKKKADKKVIKSRITIAVIIVTLLLIGLAIFGIIALINNQKYKPYRAFEGTMKTYGFDKLYDNQSAKTSESVTKSEAIKMVLACVLNTDDISEFVTDQEDTYNNNLWVEYAKFRGIIGSTDITEENADDKATYIDVIRYFANAKVKILEKELDTKSDLKVKDIDKYKTDEQVAIEDMITNEIITINTKKIKGKKNVFKGQINEIITNFVVKYNTITVGEDKVNINEDKMPYNKDEYPYTLSSVDKSIYEIKNYVSNNPIDSPKNAKEAFSERKDYYEQICNRVEKYLNIILNVDYNTIDENEFKEEISKVGLYKISDEAISSYVTYVKDNKIKIVGEGKVQLPAVYYDGENYRARTKVNYEVISAQKLSNILFRDLVSNEVINYELGKKEVIVDIPMSREITTKALYVNIVPLLNSVAGNVK